MSIRMEVEIKPLSKDLQNDYLHLFDNMVHKEGVKPVREGAQRVAKNFGQGVRFAIDLPCEYLGSTSEVEPCEGVPAHSGGIEIPSQNGGGGSSVRNGSAAASLTRAPFGWMTTVLTIASTMALVRFISS